MLIQSLLLIATMLLVGGALLTSTLVSAKAAFHQAVVRKTETAMSDTTAQFVTWAQGYVKKNGTEAAWPSGMQPQAGPIVEDLCTGAIISGGGSPKGTCRMLATEEWTVTGSSGGAGPSQPQSGPASTAQNLSAGVDEQRLSVTLTVIIADPSGKTTFADHSRQVTARIFDADPYVVVTATRDVSSEADDIHASEGDTGGAAQYDQGIVPPKQPTIEHPSAFTDTRITATIDCANSARHNDQANPYNDGNKPGNPVYVDRSQRSGGTLAWAYEAPCAPQYHIDTQGAPRSYLPPQGSTYATSGDVDKPWQKSDENGSAYSQ